MKSQALTTDHPDVVEDIYFIREKIKSRHLLQVYVSCLIQQGWKQRTMAETLGLSRTGVANLCIKDDLVEQSLEEYRLIINRPLRLPLPPSRPEKRKAPARVKASAETIEMLKDLHAKARNYRGTTKNKEESYLFTAAVYYVNTVDGVSLYSIAKEIGLTHAALSSRLVRYGYKSTTGKSGAYRKLTGRGDRNTFTHCKKGHLLNEENTYIIPKTGARLCRTCDKVRHKKYRDKLKKEKRKRDQHVPR